MANVDNKSQSDQSDISREKTAKQMACRTT